MHLNPFLPSFSKTPDIFAGRKEEIEAFQAALHNPMSPYRAAMLVGPRGSGKTALLGELRELAQKEGWLVIKILAGTDKAVKDLEKSILPKILHDLGYQGPRNTRVAGISVMDAGITTEASSPYTLSTEMSLQEICSILSQDDRQTGLLITIDELHKITPEVSNMLASVASVWEDGYPVAFLGATLPSSLHQLLSGENKSNPMTFLRRAKPISLRRISRSDLRKDLKSGIERNGKNIDDEVLDLMIQNMQGYPFLVQSLGYHTWNQSKSKYITRKNVENALNAARQDMKQAVFEPAVQDCSQIDLDVLLFIAESGGKATRESIIKSVDTINEASFRVYRKRLLDTGLVIAPKRGELRLSLPGLRSYLIDVQQGHDYDEDGYEEYELID